MLPIQTTFLWKFLLALVVVRNINYTTNISLQTKNGNIFSGEVYSHGMEGYPIKNHRGIAKNLKLGVSSYTPL